MPEKKKPVRVFHVLPRQLNIGEEVWTWEMKRTTILIRSPEGKKFVVKQNVLCGVTPDEIGRALWKKSDRNYRMTPGRIKEYILSHLLLNENEN